MYNGIGLTTARGSGTSGYVQSNKFHRQQSRLKRHEFEDLKKIHERGDRGDARGANKREGNREILEHNKKRKIEVELVAFRDALEEDEKNLTESEIEAKVNEERARLTRKMQREEAEAESMRVCGSSIQNKSTE